MVGGARQTVVVATASLFTRGLAGQPLGSAGSLQVWSGLVWSGLVWSSGLVLAIGQISGPERIVEEDVAGLVKRGA